jgi:hypothetical protein
VVFCGVFFDKILSKRERLYYDLDQLRTLASVRYHRFEPYSVALDAGAMQHNGEVVRRAQDAVPSGQTILEATKTAYGYDWRRNPVYIADYPGMAGLPPGPPVFGDAEALRAYLLHCGIHYVIYDRALYVALDFESFRKQPRTIVPRDTILGLLKRSNTPAPWSRMEYYVENSTRLQLQQIAAQHSIVYDDGRIEVIRLDG